jgi:type IV pilus assembly protein PilB
MGWDFGEFLVERRLITREQLQQARAAQQQTGEPSLLSVLLDLGFITEDQALLGLTAGNPALQARATSIGLQSIDLAQFSIDPAALAALPAHVALRHRVLPLERQGSVLVVATANPGDVFAIDDVQRASGLQVRWVVAAPDQIEAGIARHYGRR